MHFDFSNCTIAQCTVDLRTQRKNLGGKLEFAPRKVGVSSEESRGLLGVSFDKLRNRYFDRLLRPFGRLMDRARQAQALRQAQGPLK